MGFLKQQNNGSTSLSILVPNDGINPETGERPVLLGSLIGKLSHGVGSIPGFREDRRNMVKTGLYLFCCYFVKCLLVMHSYSQSHY